MAYKKVATKAMLAYRRLLKRVATSRDSGAQQLPCTALDDNFYRSIPIFINNRDLLAWPKMMVEWLANHGYRNIVILDNDSTYPPLLEFYDGAAVKVVRLGRNYGHRALFECGILEHAEYRGQMYVYSDPDCVPADNCPPDLLRRFHQILLKHPEFPKVGFSLCAWDWAYYWWEVDQGYFSTRIGNYAFSTGVDTTFALYRANISSYCVGGCRTTRPYLCRHMPWEYHTLSKEIVAVDQVPEDYLYYLLRADPGSSSITRLVQSNEHFLRHPRVRALLSGVSLRQQL